MKERNGHLQEFPIFLQLTFDKQSPKTQSFVHRKSLKYIIFIENPWRTFDLSFTKNLLSIEGVASCPRNSFKKKRLFVEQQKKKINFSMNSEFLALLYYGTPFPDGGYKKPPSGKGVPFVTFPFVNIPHSIYIHIQHKILSRLPMSVR